ncbi:MAG: hypothetical protein H6Q73_474 [Firmicutes bacterium]|nr:hypothetical protein [Bacillota bacterium]
MMNDFPSDYYERITYLCNCLKNSDLESQLEEKLVKELEALLEKRRSVLNIAKGMNHFTTCSNSSPVPASINRSHNIGKLPITELRLIYFPMNK